MSKIEFFFAQRVRSHLTQEHDLLNNIMTMHLFLILSLLIVGNVEVTELEGLLVSGNNAQPVTDLVLLQELLGKVLQVALGESNVGNNGDLVITSAGDNDGITQVVGAALNLDAVMEELFL